MVCDFDDPLVKELKVQLLEDLNFSGDTHVFQQVLAMNGLTQRSFIVAQCDGSTVNDVDIFDGPLGGDVEYRLVDLEVV